MEPFIVNNVIENVDFLFGRQNSINALISCAKRRENAGIIGARRFGKTSLLKSMLSYIESHPEINALPIYFDVKNETNIHGNTPEVYYTLAALLAKKMCETGVLQEGDFNVSRRQILDVSSDLSDMIVQMSTWHSEYQTKAFFSLTDEVCKHGKYVLLLLDEIDSLLLDAFNTPSDFGRIRGAATDKSEKLSFWIAGTSSWKSITTTIGSPELNCGLEQIRLSSLEKEDFTAMWNYECSLIENADLHQKLLSLEDSIYSKTGGVPYYAKFIGSSFMNGTITEMPDYSILRDYLMEVYENKFMTEAERSALKLLAKGSKVFVNTVPDGVNSLYLKGLAEINNSDEYYIAIQYLADYVTAISSNNILETSPDIEKKERDMLVDEIIRLRIAVNKSYVDSPFVSTDDDSIDFPNLRKPCYDESALFAFATSMYKLYYEGSGKGCRLPVGFHDNKFSKMIRFLRHKCDHQNCVSNLMDDEDFYGMINNGYPPISTEHFRNIQLNVLLLFKDELLSMLEKSPEKKQKKAKASPCMVRPQHLEDGQIYEGLIVEVSNQHGTFLNVKCSQYPYPLQIKSKLENIYEDDEVVFKAVCEPNKTDSSKSFWKADDVQLKE